jgi:ZIP family zinc transporter
VLGTVLDGIPESFVLGLTVLTQGSVNMAFLTAVFVSNIPEALSASTSLHDGGWTGGRILGMWTLIAAVSAVAAMCGYVFLDGRSPVVGMRIQAFAAGAILAMLADAMMPDGFAFGGKFAGLATVLGFVTGIGLTSLE